MIFAPLGWHRALELGVVVRDVVNEMELSMLQFTQVHGLPC